jgi:hypothetical protein
MPFDFRVSAMTSAVVGMGCLLWDGKEIFF